MRSCFWQLPRCFESLLSLQFGYLSFMSCGSFVFVKTKIKNGGFPPSIEELCLAWLGLGSSHQVMPITANHCRTSTGGGGEEESVAGAHC